jgi:hypothetical protein
MDEDSFAPCVPGDRIGVLHSACGETVMLYGFGVYEGDGIPSPEVFIPGIGPACELGMKVPKLRLDDGTIIWGCECRWTDEETVQNICEGRTIVRVKIGSIRTKVIDEWKRLNTELDEAEEALPDQLKEGTL